MSRLREPFRSCLERQEMKLCPWTQHLFIRTIWVPFYEWLFLHLKTLNFGCTTFLSGYPVLISPDTLIVTRCPVSNLGFSN
ncbi:hypothetical protein CLU79DRAFT_228485 [Phycomyces nitens]|nr:hypothetical protein CLU79DRAFT_228485 [Phycomyces nitens]